MAEASIVTEVSTGEQLDDLIRGDRVAVVDVYTTWCGPCKFYSPVFHKMAERLSDLPELQFYRANLDDPALRATFVGLGINSIPTTLILFRGCALLTRPGAMDEDQLFAELIRTLHISIVDPTFTLKQTDAYKAHLDALVEMIKAARARHEEGCEDPDCGCGHDHGDEDIEDEDEPEAEE
jgi:thiol-disulfide isomerase/thioredoxin